MCTYRRILDAEPLRAPQVFEHATLSPTITFHSNAAAQSAAHERRRAATTAPLASSAVPNGGCARLLGGSGEGPFSCACSYIGYAGVPQRQAVDGTLSVDNASFAPPCDRQRLVAKMLLSHDMRYTATGITERDDRCGTRPSGELRSPTPAVHMHMHMSCCCACVDISRISLLMHHY